MNNILNGEFRRTKKYREVISPFNGEVIGKVSISDKKDIDDAFSYSRKAFKDFKNIDDERLFAFFKEFKEKITFNILSLARIYSEETGRPISESKDELLFLINSLDFYWSKKQECEKFFKSENDLIIRKREALGEALFLLPKIDPVKTFANKVIPAIMMKNTAVIKPSSEVPLTITLISYYLAQVFPKGVIGLINGKSKEVKDLLQYDFKKITLVGRTVSGINLLSETRANISNLVLELGEANSSIISKSADIEEATSELIQGLIFNSGQSPKSIKRVFIEKEVYDEFKISLLKRMKLIKPGNPLIMSTNFTCMVSSYQTLRLSKQLEQIVGKGGCILCGGKHLKNIFEPTLVEVSKDFSTNLEILGPIILISSYDVIDEAISLVNSSIYGGISSLYSKDTSEIALFSKSVDAGNILINKAFLTDHFLKMDGYKFSSNNTMTSNPLMIYSREKLIFIEERF